MFHLDKKTLRKLTKSNMSTSLLIQFINQLMFNFQEMDITMAVTQKLLETNGDLSQLDHGLTDLEVILEKISQFHLDKLMLKRDKKNKNSILPSTQLLVELNKASQPN